MQKSFELLRRAEFGGGGKSCDGSSLSLLLCGSLGSLAPWGCTLDMGVDISRLLSKIRNQPEQAHILKWALALIWGVWAEVKSMNSDLFWKILYKSRSSTWVDVMWQAGPLHWTTEAEGTLDAMIPQCMDHTTYQLPPPCSPPAVSTKTSQHPPISDNI